jgi:hypothetical protein
MLFTGTVRRLFWVSMGATAGVLVFRQMTKAAQELTPAGIADRVTGSGGSLLDSVKEFFEDVREAAHDREEELNVALGLDDSVEIDKGKSASTSEKNGAPTSARATKGRSDDK